MKVPIIKVNGRIVGTNSHDCLYISKNAIHFMNIQGCCGSECDPEDYKFEGKVDDYNFTGCPEIEFVTIEELIEIAIKQCHESAENEKNLREMIKQYFDEVDRCQNELDDTGIITTSGTLL